MNEMFKAIANSPITHLAENITATQTIIPILDVSKLPPPPNICTIGFEEKSETIMYNNVNGNSLEGVTRAIEGVAQQWPKGTEIARFYTAYDHNAFIDNLKSLEVIEVGGDASGYYKKYADGTMVCWGNKESEVAITNQWITGGLYYAFVNVYYPKEFIEKPVYSVNTYDATESNYGTIVAGVHNKPNMFRVMLVRPSDTRVYGLSYRAIGRWK